MGHHISALVTKGPFSVERATELSLPAIDLGYDLTMFPLCADFLDELAANEGIEQTGSYMGSGPESPPVLDGPEIAHLAQSLAPNSLYAVIETDYFGGNGGQAAVVYRGDTVVMPPCRSQRGPVNKALRTLGVVRRSRLDEFDTVGLGRYRTFEDLFARYYDETQQCRPTSGRWAATEPPYLK